MQASQDADKSVYRILVQYIKSAKKCGNYIKGYVDGKDQLDAFLADYFHYSNTKFIVRSSCKKYKEYVPAASKTNNGTRYGREDRIYWEFNNRTLVVPFFGTPFTTHSSQIKHCQHGSVYYKLKPPEPVECSSTQQMNTRPCQKSIFLDDIDGFQNHNAEGVKRRRRQRPTKKRNCPAYMYIREVVLFPQFSISAEKRLESRQVLRKEKATLIVNLKKAMAEGHVDTIHRYYMHIPLPEAHSDHPTDAGMAPLKVIDPFVRSKIDELLASGTYEMRHIQLIVNDYVNESLLKNEIAGFQSEPLHFPSEQEIKDYIYLTNLTANSETEPTENEKLIKNALQNEMTKSVNELMTLINNCSDDEALSKAKAEVTKVIRRVKQSSARPAVPYEKASHTIRQAVKSGTSQHPEPIHIPPQDVGCQNSGMLMHQHHTNEDLDSGLMLPHINITQSDMLPTFSRLMESSEPVMLSGLDDRLMGHNADFHHSQISNSIMHELRTPHPSFLK